MTTTVYRRRVMKSYHLRRLANGGESTLIDATPLQPILRDMRARMSWPAVAELVGTTSHKHMSSIASGEVRRVSPDMFRRVLEASRRDPADGGSWVSSRGSMRRVRALQALGYSAAMIAREVDGYSEGAIKALSRGEKPIMRADRAKAIRDAYERLSMRLPVAADQYERGAITRARKKAQESGWAPPLAWDDIDRDSRPVGYDLPSDDADPVVVERLLAGERIDSTRAEKVEALRRWTARGGSERELCKRMGWKPGRYSERAGVAA